MQRATNRSADFASLISFRREFRRATLFAQALSRIVWKNWKEIVNTVEMEKLIQPANFPGSGVCICCIVTSGTSIDPRSIGLCAFGPEDPGGIQKKESFVFQRNI